MAGDRNSPASYHRSPRSNIFLRASKYQASKGSAMSGRTVTKKISPMLAAENMDETVLFYRNVLGFEPTMQSPEYSIVERDGQTIHFQKAASEEVMNCVRGHTEIYIEVSDIHFLWENVRRFKNRYKIGDLFDREYGMTEFHIIDPNGCLVFVGEPSSKMKTGW
jgi:predicted enzyme related to lactoylglutathione lyase